MTRSWTFARGPVGALGAVLAASLVLTACGGDDGGGSNGGEAGQEQVLRVATSVAPVSLDTHGEQSAESGLQGIMQHVLDPLVRLESGEFVPVLAESWENPDDLTWVFSLRDDVEFHDGTPLTAEDVKASAERLIELDGPLAPLWAGVESIEATDEHTVTISTEEPMGTVISTASLLYVGPADQIGEEGFWQSPVGSGPFLFDSFTPDERVVLTGNDEYWAGAPELDRLEFIYIPEISGRLTALQTGEVDLTTGVPPDQVSSVEGQDGIVFELAPSYVYYFNWFNASEEPFDDPDVRRAMWHAVNIEGVVNDLFGDAATVARAPIPQDVFGAPQLTPYEYDPDLARQMLADAGYPGGFETTLQWPREQGANIRALAQAFISDWAEIGVTVEPLEKERAQWIDDLNALNWDMNLQTNSVGTGDADYTLGRLYTCEANRNGYCSEELDGLLRAARQAVDPDERIDYYAQVSQHIWDEAVGIFPMDLSSNVAQRERVQNFTLNPNGRPYFYQVSVTTD
ncbi:ABC transporter substrate-binding protein [Phytoactinopolyspora alkaliphila]|uniref:ABC transporter substrate-binding protein n=1 Tax=Phytoactinopolyspora alkaliphila TaxID=1783498 RepID=A0A6N9YTR9_9ACTN|nr:ABC transporter substrate-binding protein [Phytoactinopolyspora alkaliphila]NED98209.1 ABC transporter substrate-binding protein [Phytoactinopolyspora alkaliphila]